MFLNSQKFLSFSQIEVEVFVVFAGGVIVGETKSFPQLIQLMGGVMT